MAKQKEAKELEEKKEEMNLILSNITAAEKEEFREAFKLFDKDGDGEITVDEIHQVFTSLGFKSFSKKDILRMVKAQDVNSNETIDLDEFILLLRSKRTGKYKRMSFDDELKLAFKVFDVNGDGSISASELAGIMRALGENLDEKDIDFMIKSIDINSDGEIDFLEFKKMMQHAPIAQETVSKLKEIQK